MNDPEVRGLAEMTGRSGASISRRLGNFHGTFHDGRAGLKAVTGEARELFLAMAQDSELRDRLAAEARTRLLSGRRESPVALPTAGVRLVERERFMVDTADVEVAASSRLLVRREAQLVDRYVGWLGEAGVSLQSWLIPVDGASLRTDLFDPERNLLVEAKASAGRGDVRYAIGQLYDYRRCLPSSPSLALLTPQQPSRDLKELLTYAGVGSIWEEDGSFIEHLL